MVNLKQITYAFIEFYCDRILKLTRTVKAQQIQCIWPQSTSTLDWTYLTASISTINIHSWNQWRVHDWTWNWFIKLTITHNKIKNYYYYKIGLKRKNEQNWFQKNIVTHEIKIILYQKLTLRKMKWMKICSKTQNDNTKKNELKMTVSSVYNTL